MSLLEKSKNNITLHFMIVAVSALSIVSLAGCKSDDGSVAEQRQTLAAESFSKDQPAVCAQPASIEEQWGIRVESIRLSAGGYMIDFRFRVLDAAKAAPLLDRGAKPYLIDETTGAAFIVPNPPKVGQLRSGKNIREGKIYFIFFANPGNYIKSGRPVTVVIGDFRAEHLVVQ